MWLGISLENFGKQERYIMNKFRKYNSTVQYSGLVKTVRDHCSYHNLPLPTLKFTGSTKIHGCVHSDTLITLADGSYEKIKDISVGTSILSFNENTNEVEFDIVNDLIVQNLEKQWVELKFDNGVALKCTIDHPILTTVGWIEANNLTEEHIFITEN